MKSKQYKFLKDMPKAYGGELRKKRGARGARPIATKNTIHLVLRSSQARGDWSFRKHKREISQILAKFSTRYGVKLLSLANVGNHLHMQIKLSNRFTYKSFIKAITGAITMAVTKVNKFAKLKRRFWDYRPFTRVVIGFKARLNLQSYLEINKLEGEGYSRSEAVHNINVYEDWLSSFSGHT